jgi:glycosyltransferase involved in cell wall biosynthesis
MSAKTGVLHLIDSLTAAGAEHMAVMIANNSPQESYHVYLCASRTAGPLQSRIQPHVSFLDLRRRGRFDLVAIVKLANFVRSEHIRIIHAHSTSLFLGAVVCLLNPKVRLIWHDHFGFQEKISRSAFLYRLFSRRTQTVFAVTRRLTDWSVNVLGISRARVIYMPNFVEGREFPKTHYDLPGENGKRIVCVANVRAQKDHLTLILALAQIVQDEPSAHLLLVGEETDAPLTELVRDEIRRYGLKKQLTWLGSREDVPMILTNCDIGVLSSVSEGFPVTLLEYGRAGLAVVSTQVGECAEILEDGEAGLLIPVSNPTSLASALLRLLTSPELRNKYGEKLKNRVEHNYSVEVIMQRVCQVYEDIL